MKDTDFTKIAKALADPTRLKMLRDVRDAGELTCSCLCERFPLSQPTISHHIRALEDAGLLTVRKDGQFHRLTVNEELLAGFSGHLSAVPAATTPPKPKARAPRATPARKASSSKG